MPRHPRLYVPYSLHHLIGRIVNGEYRIQGAEERAEYLRRVPRVLAATDGNPLAYALMSNHMHWAWQAGLAPPSRFIHPLHVGFAGWLNRRQGRSGPVFMERFTSLVCDAERTAVLIAYQHNNPVRAGLVQDPAECDWTSHRAYLGLERAPPWLNVEAALAACGFDSSPSGRLAFHAFVLARAGTPREAALSGSDGTEARRRVRAMVGAPVEVSDAGFVAGSTSAFREVAHREGGILRPRWPGSPVDVAGRVATEFGVELGVMQSRNRRPHVVGARRMATWLWARELGRAQSEMNAVLGVSSGTGSVSLRYVSDAERQLAGELANELWVGIDPSRQ